MPAPTCGVTWSPGHERLDPAHHGEVERAQDRVGDRPGARLRRACARAAAAAAPHGSRPVRSEPGDEPGQQQRERAAGERRRDLLLLLARGQPAAEVRVDGLEVARRRRGEEAPARRARDRRRASPCRAAPGVIVPSFWRSRPVLRAERDRVDRDLEALGHRRDRARVLALRARAVGEQDDRARQPLRPAVGADHRRADRVDARAAGRRPSRCRPAPSGASSARSTCARSVVGSDTCSTRVLNEITPSRNSSGSERDERPRRVARRAQAVGLDVGRLHRARRVVHEHHRALALLDGDRALRAPERDAERGEREQREQGRHVPPARPARDARQHVDRRIADRVAPAPALREPGTPASASGTRTSPASSRGSRKLIAARCRRLRPARSAAPAPARARRRARGRRPRRRRGPRR